MKSITIKTMNDFIESTDYTSGTSKIIIYRGQDVKGNLLPKICRDEPALNATKKEVRQLAQLRLMGASFLTSLDEDDWDLLVRAQHFGLRTRLLDWTSNPLTALWFACNSVSEGNAYVYALVADDLLVKKYEKGPFKQTLTRVIQPRLANPRIIAQHGWFTAHCYAVMSNKFVALEKNPVVKKSLTEIVIPSNTKGKLLKTLDRLGVNERTLFPDFSGLCSYLNWTSFR